MAQLIDDVRETFKNVLADFSVKGGGGSSPFPLRVFWQNDFPLRGGVPPNSAKEKNLLFSP